MRTIFIPIAAFAIVIIPIVFLFHYNDLKSQHEFEIAAYQDRIDTLEKTIRGELPDNITLDNIEYLSAGFQAGRKKTDESIINRVRESGELFVPVDGEIVHLIRAIDTKE